MKNQLIKILAISLVFWLTSCAAPRCSKSLTPNECDELHSELWSSEDKLSNARKDYWAGVGKAFAWPVGGLLYFWWMASSYDLSATEGEKDAPPDWTMLPSVVAGGAVLLGIPYLIVEDSWTHDIYLNKTKMEINLLEMCIENGIAKEDCK